MVTENSINSNSIRNPYANCGNLGWNMPFQSMQTVPFTSAYNTPEYTGMVSSGFFTPVVQPLQRNIPAYTWGNCVPSGSNFFNSCGMGFSIFNKTSMSGQQYNFYNPASYNFCNTQLNFNLKAPMSMQSTKSFSMSAPRYYKSWSKMTDSEIYSIYGNYKRSITKKYNGSVEKLNKYLKGKGVLENQGKAFMDAQEKYGISASVLVAICTFESGKGRSSNARNKNNVGGIRASSDSFKTFKSVPACIDYMANLLNEHYVDNSRSLNNLALVNAKYCPVTDKSGSVKGQSSWASKVDKLASEVEQA